MAVFTEPSQRRGAKGIELTEDTAAALGKIPDKAEKEKR
jgi:hypothetical protein